MTAKDGVELLSVSPGGPAAEAGLKAGDVIVELKGKSLKQTGDETPREKLLAVMREVEARRENHRALCARWQDGVRRRSWHAPSIVCSRCRLRLRGGADRGNAEFQVLASRWRSSAPQSSCRSHRSSASTSVPTKDCWSCEHRVRGLPLEEGDVILDIDGRVPSNPSHAFRILGSYQPGEVVKLNVLRMKKRIATRCQGS